MTMRSATLIVLFISELPLANSIRHTITAEGFGALEHTTPDGKAAACSTVPLQSCKTVDHCKVHQLRVNDKLFVWCVPKCGHGQIDSALCESPWCVWAYWVRKNGTSKSTCLDYYAPQLLQVDPKSVQLPGWRVMDSTPAGFSISKVPCGPGVGAVTKKYIDERYNKNWGHFWAADERSRLYLNGHLMKLNGCQECQVFDTHGRNDNDYFEGNYRNNELVVTCIKSSCHSPNFFVAQNLANTFESYCHHCPPQCSDCEYKHRVVPWQDRKFKCILKPGFTVPPTGCTGDVKERKNAEGWKVTCKVRPFYLNKAGTDLYYEDRFMPQWFQDDLEEALPEGWGAKAKLTIVAGDRLAP